MPSPSPPPPPPRPRRRRLEVCPLMPPFAFHCRRVPTRDEVVSCLSSHSKNPGANRIAGAEKRNFFCGALHCNDRARRRGRPRAPPKFRRCCRIFFLIFIPPRARKSPGTASAHASLKSAQKWPAAGRDVPISAIAIGERASQKLVGGGGVERDSKVRHQP